MFPYTAHITLSAWNISFVAPSSVSSSSSNVQSLFGTVWLHCVGAGSKAGGVSVVVDRGQHGRSDCPTPRTTSCHALHVVTPVDLWQSWICFHAEPCPAAQGGANVVAETMTRVWKNHLLNNIVKQSIPHVSVALLPGALGSLRTVDRRAAGAMSHVRGQICHNTASG